MPDLKDLRYRAEYMALRLVEALLRSVPLDFGVKVSAKTWRLIARFDHRHQRALDNLAIAFPYKTLRERQAIALAMWENLGRVMAETMQIDRILAEPSRIEIVTQNIHRRYKDKLGPAIGVSLHMGNWELAIWPFTLAGNNPAAVYRTVKNPYVDRYVREARKLLYPGGLLGRGRDREEGQTTARRIMGFVRDGGRLGLVCDLHDRAGLPVPFFGKPAPSVTIPAMIARRRGLAEEGHRQQSRFKIELKELKVPRSASQADDVKWVTVAMQRQFEDWIREEPEQWMWSNRRWA